MKRAKAIYHQSSRNHAFWFADQPGAIPKRLARQLREPTTLRAASLSWRSERFDEKSGVVLERLCRVRQSLALFALVGLRTHQFDGHSFG